jgi:hypothetical protein
MENEVSLDGNTGTSTITQDGINVSEEAVRGLMEFLRNEQHRMNLKMITGKVNTMYEKGFWDGLQSVILVVSGKISTEGVIVSRETKWEDDTFWYKEVD